MPNTRIRELHFGRGVLNPENVKSIDPRKICAFAKEEKDSYGNEVSRLARPLPVEYLLVDVPASTPVTPQYTFNSEPSKQPFPVENRFVDGHIQDFNALSTYLSQFAFNEFYTAINDFHLLIYIATMEMLPMRDFMNPLLEALKNKDREAASEWSRSEHWATVEQLIAASSPPPSRPGSVASGSVTTSTGAASGPKWTCPFCTFSTMQRFKIVRCATYHGLAERIEVSQEEEIKNICD
ncbi:hypothetical protein NQ317_001610 [Molorchus minor]|uniref:Nuclear pore localisation protein NPL4 C-terminal domain-containing protein n=1 Tax=Molorchus minor TaxID=1323400 RepID=A0ABQ9JST5_9CUCU|nr:hypothetical protein NQ317_001610 [Molorchus minor]